MSEGQKRKVLRVGVIQGGRIIEERILRRSGRVTVGQSPRNTFSIPVAQLPASYVLFDFQKGGYVLRFVRGMDGLVSLDGNVVHLRTLVEKKLAARQGKHFLYSLGEDGRGKVVLGEVTLLFQFVDPPPPISRLRLPANVHESWWKRIDLYFASILLLSFLLQGGGVGAVQVWWLTTGQFEEKITPPPPLMEALKFEVKVEEPEDDPEDEEIPRMADAGFEDTESGFDDPAREEEVLLEEEPEKTPGKKLSEEEEKAARYARQRERVHKETLAGLIGSRGPGSDASAYGSTLASGATKAKMLAAVSGPGTEVAAFAGKGHEFRSGGGGGDDASGGYREISRSSRYDGKIETGKVQTGKKGREVKVRGRIKGSLGKRSGIGKIDEKSVATVFRRRRTAVQRCYEQALRGNPGIQGKVVIQFTIGQAGRITKISVKSDTTGEPSIARCIVSRVKGWRFEPPERGVVTFSYPFILSHG